EVSSPPRTGAVRYDRPVEDCSLIAESQDMAPSLLGVKRRVIGFFLVLLLLGAGAGYAWAAATEDPGPSRFSDAAPLSAESPSVPVEPERPYAEDVDMATLPPDLRYQRETIGEAPFQY